MATKIEASACDAGPGILLAGGCQSHSKNHVEKQSDRTILKAENGHLIGSPRVIIDRRPGSVKVWLSSPPWGWGRCQVEFLNPRPGGAADRYAASLKQRIEMEATRDLARRECLKANGAGK